MIGLARLIAPNRISCSSYLSKQRNRRLVVIVVLVGQSNAYPRYRVH